MEQIHLEQVLRIIYSFSRCSRAAFAYSCSLNMPKVYIAIYKPLYGNFKHWALHLKDGSEETIYEVIGEHPRFERNRLDDKRPECSKRHIENIHVGDINQRDVPAFKKIIRRHKWITKLLSGTVRTTCWRY